MAAMSSAAADAAAKRISAEKMLVGVKTIVKPAGGAEAYRKLTVWRRKRNP